MFVFEEAAIYIIAFALILALIALIIVYVILPILGIIVVSGLCYGGFFAIRNYAAAFSEITVEGNKS